MSADIWTLDRDLCRCCHAEGIFNNLAEPRGRNAQKEIYSDMLKDCFEINILPVPGTLCEITYTICEACILRLKDAFDFMKQVQKCEEKFKDFYNRDAIKAARENSNGTDIKVEMPEYISDCKDDYPMDYEEDFINFDNDEPRKEEILPKVVIAKKGKGTSKAKAKIKTDPQKKESSCDKEDTTDVAVRKKDDITNPAGNFSVIVNEEGIKLHSCNTCKKRFMKRNHFIQHYKLVHLKLRQKFRSCYLCDEKVTAHLRAAHLEEKHGIPAPTCNACGRKFAFPNEVVRHQKYYHMGEKKFQCSDCGKRFSYKALLTQHVIMHTTLRAFTCQICEKSFKREKTLRTHLRIHLNDRRYVCKICKEAFVQIGSLKYHMIKRHPEAV
ncbi:zinc finger protein 892-like isoform X4 [Battus philenor]|uniref:zinc finger protein 892-like isoform X4 n=1 Tax=Battus philenor TaxID=42288 RepID=UPI0035D05DC1